MNLFNRKKIKKAAILPIVFGVISSIIIYSKLQPNESFFKKWFPFYIIGLLIVAPIAIILFKSINNLLAKYAYIKYKYINGLVFGLLFSGCVGFLLSTLLALLSNNYNNFSDFIIIWKMTIYSFIPRILILGPLLGGVVKPLIQHLRNKRLIQKTKENDTSF